MLTLSCLPFLGLGGFGQLGLAASRSLICKPGSVTSKRIRFVSKVLALDSSVRRLVCTPLMLVQSVGFCLNGFKKPPLNLCTFPRLVFVVGRPGRLVRLLRLISSCLCFLHRHRFFFFYFESLLWASQDCFRGRRS
jgi:hypothetical protein